MCASVNTHRPRRDMLDGQVTVAENGIDTDNRRCRRSDASAAILHSYGQDRRDITKIINPRVFTGQ